MGHPIVDKGGWTDEKAGCTDEKAGCTDEKAGCTDEKAGCTDEKGVAQMKKVVARMKKGVAQMKKGVARTNDGMTSMNSGARPTNLCEYIPLEAPSSGKKATASMKTCGAPLHEGDVKVNTPAARSEKPRVRTNDRPCATEMCPAVAELLVHQPKSGPRCADQGTPFVEFALRH